MRRAVIGAQTVAETSIPEPGVMMTDTGGDGPLLEEHGIRVLLLDEDRVEGGMLAFHLRRDGCVVMLMASAEEAFDAMDWAAPDVLVMDVSDGLRELEPLLERLEEQGGDALATSDKPLSGDMELALLRLGVLDTLIKPVDPQTLARRIGARPVEKRGPRPEDIPPEAFSGTLARHSPLQILQLLQRHKMSARLHVEMDGDWGVLLVRHGDLVDAEGPHATGRTAAVQMLRLVRGAFVLFPLEPDSEELGRDDVIRTDLPTLAAEAIPRTGPRTRRPPTREIGSGLTGTTRRPLEANEPPPAQGDGGQTVAVALMTEPPAVDAGVQVGRPRLPTQPNLVELARYDNEPVDVSVRLAVLEPTVESTIDEPERGLPSEAKTGPRPRNERHSSRRMLVQTSPGETLVGTDDDVPESEDDGAREVRETPDEPAAGRATARDRRPEPLSVWSDPWVRVLLVALLAAVGLLVFRLSAREVSREAPRDIEARLGMALMALDAGHREEALAALRALDEDRLAPLAALTTLGRLVHEDGDLEGTRRTLERAVLLSPEIPELHVWLGLLSIEQGKVEAAQDALEMSRRMGASGTAMRKLETLLRPRGGTP